jgi:hypothetical protein
MPSMRKKFIRYKDYSGTTLNKLFSPEQQKGMDIYTANFFESGVLINEGNGAYHFVAFPEKAQFSNINDFVVDDFDKDGIKERYKELRRSGKNTHGKGGGIGFYEIAKRCDKLEFDFNEINSDKYYFHVKTTISNKKGE